MKPTKCQAQEKNEARKVKEEQRRERKSQDGCVTLTVSQNFAFYACLNIRSLYFVSGSEGCEVYDL